MPWRVDGPSAAAAAITEENPARTSGMVTSAPCSFDTPRTTAECTADESWNRQAGPAEAGVEQLDLAAHRLHRLDVAEPVLVDGLVQHRHAVGLGHEHDERRLPVRHEPGVGVGLHGGRVELRRRWR